MIFHAASVLGLVLDELVADNAVLEGLVFTKFLAFVAAASQDRPDDEENWTRHPEGDVLTNVKDQQDEKEGTVVFLLVERRYQVRWYSDFLLGFVNRP